MEIVIKKTKGKNDFNFKLDGSGSEIMTGLVLTMKYLVKDMDLTMEETIDIIKTCFEIMDLEDEKVLGGFKIIGKEVWN